MRLRFWNSSQSSTLVMIDGCLDNPKTSAPNRNTRVATYWFAPLIKLTTAMTADTPMTTPTSVRTLRSLCAQRLEVEMATASEKFIVLRDRKAVAGPGELAGAWARVVGLGIGLCGYTNARYPNIRAAEHWSYAGPCGPCVSAVSGAIWTTRAANHQGPEAA